MQTKIIISKISHLNLNPSGMISAELAERKRQRMMKLASERNTPFEPNDILPFNLNDISLVFTEKMREELLKRNGCLMKELAALMEKNFGSNQNSTRKTRIIISDGESPRV